MFTVYIVLLCVLWSVYYKYSGNKIPEMSKVYENYARIILNLWNWTDL